jgi:hypothetical protein
VEPNVRPDEFTAYYVWAMNDARGFHNPEPVGPVPVVRGPPTLAQITRDPQSVHTAPVSVQTNVAMEKLLALPVVSGRQPIKSLARRWLYMRGLSWKMVSRVANDMDEWYDKTACRKPGDKLYRRLLDGLYAYIASVSEETQRELCRRVFEECQDAVGMCCEGHLSRLCNVLVGFDSAFASPVSKGEILQNKFAALASQDIPATEKMSRAREMFVELDVPATEQGGWLDALAE